MWFRSFRVKLKILEKKSGIVLRKESEMLSTDGKKSGCEGGFHKGNPDKNTVQK